MRVKQARSSKAASGGAHGPSCIGAFTVTELVIVLVIIGIISAIAIRRFSSATQTANQNTGDYSESALQQAIDRYHAEHGSFPSDTRIVDQLTTYSDEAGSTSTLKTTRYRFGPYIRKIPAAATGTNAGSSIIGGRSNTAAGWLYNENSGKIDIWSPPPGNPRDD